ncbi:MAG: NUDIX domain-containing protein [Bacilli bacterium]|nr:NUDIX domain-containing protein [Bacilli bacterium]
MEHIMKLYESSFEELKRGNKKREYRLYDEKRKQIRVGDTIKFIKLPNLDEEFIVDVNKIEIFKNWYDCYSMYYDEDFKDKYSSVEEIVQDTYNGGYYTKEESNKNKCVVFTIKKHRVQHLNATVCYLKQNDKVLMLRFSKKWGMVYSPPGGKFESGESPLECIMREFYEETGLTLKNPRLQGISYWKDSSEGIIFIYTADEYTGKLTTSSNEGTLKWIDLKDLPTLKQFQQNEKFTPYLFKKELFEGKFLLDDACNVIDYEIKLI